MSELSHLIQQIREEGIRTKPGSDESLLPVYSLLGELRDRVEGDGDWEERVDQGKALLEDVLEKTGRFTEESHAAWLEYLKGLVATGEGEVPPEPAETPESSARADHLDYLHEDSVEEPGLLQLELDENREMLEEFLPEAQDHLEQIEAALLRLEQTPEDREAIDSIFRSFHTLKGVSGFLNLVPIRVLSHAVEDLLDLARNDELRLNSLMISELLKCRDAVQALLGQIATSLETGKEPKELVRISELLKRIREFRDGGHGGGETEDASLTREELGTLLSSSEDREPMDSSPSSDSSVGGGGSASIRVNTVKLDALMDVVGELVILESQLDELVRRPEPSRERLQRCLGQFGRITKELQNSIMSLRMIPIRQTFQRMERIVRDICQGSEKRVQFVTEGSETELDRIVIEQIGDPLVHMVRNSLDHGIETPSERARNGKAREGVIQLEAYHRGGEIVIQLADDGRGIDTAKILAKAERLGLVTPGRQYTEQEIYNFIFLPGFSTADTLTTVSGRGVGMDVVRRNLERLRGKIEIESEVGVGSVFRIILPLTMAIIDGLVVRVGTERYIIPTYSVRVTLRPGQAEICDLQGGGEVLSSKGEIHPVLFLGEYLEVPGYERRDEYLIVMLEVGTRTLGLVVDQIQGKQEVVIKSLGGYFPNLSGISGGAILGNGEVSLILDPADLVQGVDDVRESVGSTPGAA